MVKDAICKLETTGLEWLSKLPSRPYMAKYSHEVTASMVTSTELVQNRTNQVQLWERFMEPNSSPENCWTLMVTTGRRVFAFNDVDAGELSLFQGIDPFSCPWRKTWINSVNHKQDKSKERDKRVARLFWEEENMVGEVDKKVVVNMTKIHNMNKWNFQRVD